MIKIQPLSIQELDSICSEICSEVKKISKKERWSDLKGIFQQKQKRLLDLVEKVNLTFAHLEQKGVKVFDPTIQNPEFSKMATEYRQEKEKYLKLARDVLDYVSQLDNLSPKLKKAYLELKRREISFRYFLGQENGGLDSLDKPNSQLITELRYRAIDWKKKQKLAVNHSLNELEEMQLADLTMYPEWLKVIYEDPDYLTEVFNWTLRDFNQSEVMIKCYETRNKIKKALLSANFGYVRNFVLTPIDDEVLAFKNVSTKVSGVYKNILTCAIYHGSFEKFELDQQERFNILKPSGKIYFKQGNYTLTVEQFLEESGKKNQKEVNINLCGDWGFVNFHPVKGVWHQDQKSYKMPNMTKDNWFNLIPAARFASTEELEAQYDDEIKQKDFFYKIMAGCKNENAVDCHAFWQLFIRMKNGDWKVINPGPYAPRFPKNGLDSLWLFCETLLRVLCMMDQNAYYTHRQRGGIAYFPTAKKMELLNKIYELSSKQGVFQFAGKNCAYYVQNITKEVYDDLPNFFRMPVTKAKTGLKYFDALLSWAHNRWNWLRLFVLHIIHTFFLSHRSVNFSEDGKKINYSIRKFYRDLGYDIFNPSFLLYQIGHAKGKGPFAKGELYWSHSDEKMFQFKAIKTNNMELDEEEE